MIMVDAEVVIDRPAVEVFAFLMDLRNEPRWWTGVSSSQRLSGDGGVGTRYRMRARLLGIGGTWDIEVVAQRPPLRQTIVAKGRMSYTCHYELTPGAAGAHPASSDATVTAPTVLRLAAEIARSGPWRLLGPLFRPAIRAVMRHHLRRLDRILAG